QIYSEIGSKYGLYVNKKKSSIIVENRESIIQHNDILKKVFDNNHILKIETWKKELEIIFNLNDLQIKFYLLVKYHNISKMNYILRNIPIKFDGEVYKQLKNVKKLILNAMVPFVMNHQQVRQAELVSRYGGI